MSKKNNDFLEKKGRFFFKPELTPEEFMCIFLNNLSDRFIETFNMEYLFQFIIECIKEDKYPDLLENFNIHTVNGKEYCIEFTQARVNAEISSWVFQDKDNDNIYVVGSASLDYEKDFSFFTQEMDLFINNFLKYEMDKSEERTTEKVSKSL